MAVAAAVESTVAGLMAVAAAVESTDAEGSMAVAVVAESMDAGVVCRKERAGEAVADSRVRRADVSSLQSARASRRRAQHA